MKSNQSFDTAIQLLLVHEAESVTKLKQNPGDTELLKEKVTISAAIKCLQFCQKNTIPLTAEVIKVPLPQVTFGSLRVYEMDEDDTTLDAFDWQGRPLDLDYGDLILKPSLKKK